MLIDDIAEALGGAKRTPSGFVCRCPCHDDREASLSIKETEKGLIFHCFAGCAWEDIKKELISRRLIDEPKIKKNLESSHDGNHSQKRKSKYDGAKFYIYKDVVGNTLCRKVKLPDKKMWFERLDGTDSGARWVSGLNKLQVPLYNIEAVSTSDLVYLCEGEKDAESLISRGFCATTNHAGALSWGTYLSESLKDKIVIIIPDNDEAGKKRVKLLQRHLTGIARELRVFMPPGVPEHGDITDWLNAGGDASTIVSLSLPLTKEKTKKATQQDYFELFDKVLGNPRRCIFNEKLMYYDEETRLWNPAINELDTIRARCLVENEKESGIKFNVSYVTPHFADFSRSKPPEFLVDIPEWDGQDRISEMAYFINLKKEQNFSPETVSELLKEWCSRVFERLENPDIQNRIFVLQGAQGIGKDTWISLLVDGLGQFSLPLSIIKEDKDTYLNLHRGLIMKISEFDKTAKAEVSTLKDIITAPSTNLRAPYDRDAKVRINRCSFISSANAESLLRDHTGNRRFLIFEIESIEYPFRKWGVEEIRAWQMQCLAEMRELARSRYRASATSWEEMQNYIEGQTPTNPIDDVVELFLEKCKSDLGAFLSADNYMLSDTRIVSLVTSVSKDTGLNPRAINSMLRRRLGVFRKVGKSRQWLIKIPDMRNGNHEVIEQKAQGLLDLAPLNV